MVLAGRKRPPAGVARAAGGAPGEMKRRRTGKLEAEQEETSEEGETSEEETPEEAGQDDIRQATRGSRAGLAARRGTAKGAAKRADAPSLSTHRGEERRTAAMRPSTGLSAGHSRRSESFPNGVSSSARMERRAEGGKRDLENATREADEATEASRRERERGSEGKGTRDRDGFLIPRPLPGLKKKQGGRTVEPRRACGNERVETKGRGEAEGRAKTGKARAVFEGEDGEAEAGTGRKGLGRGRKRSPSPAPKADESEDEEEDDEEEEGSSSTSEDDSDDEDYEDEEQPRRLRMQRLSRKRDLALVPGSPGCPVLSSASSDASSSLGGPERLSSLAVLLPLPRYASTSGPPGAVCERPGRGPGEGRQALKGRKRKGGEDASAAHVSAPASRGERKRRRREKADATVAALSASLDSLISVQGVIYCPYKVAEVIAAEVALAGREQEETSERGRGAAEGAQRALETETHTRGDEARAERERQSDEKATARIAALGAAIFNMLLEAGGLASPLFRPQHLAPLLLQAYALRRRASAPRRPSASRAALAALPSASGASHAAPLPAPSSAGATAARRILQKGVCRLFARLMEEQDAAASRAKMQGEGAQRTLPERPGDEAMGGAAARALTLPEDALAERSIAGGGERQHCALLESPRQAFRDFRALLKRVFLHATLLCEREGALQSQGGAWGGLLGLLSGLAGSGARRMRASATLAVLGVAEGLAVSVGPLHAEETQFRQQLQQLQGANAGPPRPPPPSSAHAGDAAPAPPSTWGTRVAEDVRARLELAESKARVCAQLLDVLAAESLAFRVRDVCPLIRSETLDALAHDLLPRRPILFLGSPSFAAAVLSSLSSLASVSPPYKPSGFLQKTLRAALRFFAFAVALLCDRQPATMAAAEERDARAAEADEDDRLRDEVTAKARNVTRTFVKAAKSLVLLLACQPDEETALVALDALLPAVEASVAAREAEEGGGRGGDAAARGPPGEQRGRKTARAARSERAERPDVTEILRETPSVETAESEEDQCAWSISEEDAEALLRAFWATKGMRVAAAYALLLEKLFLRGRLAAAAERECGARPLQNAFVSASGEREIRLLLAFCLSYLPRENLSAASPAQLLHSCAGRVVEGFWPLSAGLRRPKLMLELLTRGEAEGDPRAGLSDEERKILLHFCERSFAVLQLRQRGIPAKHTDLGAEPKREDRHGIGEPRAHWGCSAAATLAEGRTEKSKPFASRRKRRASAGGVDLRELDAQDEVDEEREEREEERQCLVEGTEAIFAHLPMLVRIHQADRDELYLLLSSVYWASFPPPCLPFHLSQRSLSLSGSSVTLSLLSSSFFSPLSLDCLSPALLCARTSSFFSASSLLACLSSLALSSSSPLATRTVFSCLSNLGFLLSPLGRREFVASLSELHDLLLARTVDDVEALQALLFRQPAAKARGGNAEAREETGQADGAGSALPLDSQREDAHAPPVFDLRRIKKSRKLRDATQRRQGALEANLLRVASFYSTCLSFLVEKREGEKTDEGAEGARPDERLFSAFNFVSLTSATEAAVAVLHLRVVAASVGDGEDSGDEEGAEVPEVPTARLVLHASDVLLAVYAHLSYRSFFLLGCLTSALRRVARLQTLAAQPRERGREKPAESSAFHGLWDADANSTEASGGASSSGRRTERHSLDGDDGGGGNTGDASRKATEEDVERARKEVLELSRQLQQTLAEAAACRNRSTVLLVALLETETRPLVLFNSLFSLLSFEQMESSILAARRACCRALASLSSALLKPGASSSSAWSAEVLLPALQAYEYIPSDVESVAATFHFFLDLLLASPVAADPVSLLSPETRAIARRLGGTAEKRSSPASASLFASFARLTEASAPFSAALSPSPFGTALPAGAPCVLLLAMSRYDASALSYLDSLVLAPSSPSSASSLSSASVAVCAASPPRHAWPAQGAAAGLDGGESSQEGDASRAAADFALSVKESLALGCCRLVRQSCMSELRWLLGGLGAGLLSLLDHPSAAVGLEARAFLQALKRENFRLLLQALLQTAQDLFETRLVTPLALVLLQRGDTSGRLRDEDVEPRFLHLFQWTQAVAQRLGVGALSGSQQTEMMNFWKAAIRHNRMLAEEAATHAESEKVTPQDGRIASLNGDAEDEEKAFARARRHVLWQLQEGGTRGEAGTPAFPRLQFLDVLHPLIQKGFLPHYLLNQLAGLTRELMRRKEEDSTRARESADDEDRRRRWEDRERRLASWDTCGEKRLFEAARKKEGWLSLLQNMREERRRRLEAAAERRKEAANERDRRHAEEREEKRRSAEERLERAARGREEETKRSDREKRARGEEMVVVNEARRSAEAETSEKRERERERRGAEARLDEERREAEATRKRRRDEDQQRPHRNEEEKMESKKRREPTTTAERLPSRSKGGAGAAATSSRQGDKTGDKNAEAKPKEGTREVRSRTPSGSEEEETDRTEISATSASESEDEEWEEEDDSQAAPKRRRRAGAKAAPSESDSRIEEREEETEEGKEEESEEEEESDEDEGRRRRRTEKRRRRRSEAARAEREARDRPPAKRNAADKGHTRPPRSLDARENAAAAAAAERRREATVSAGAREKAQSGGGDEDLWRFAVSPAPPSRTARRDEREREDELRHGLKKARERRRGGSAPPSSRASEEEHEDWNGSEFDVWEEDGEAILDAMERVCSLNTDHTRDAREKRRPVRRPQAPSRTGAFPGDSDQDDTEPNTQRDRKPTKAKQKHTREEKQATWETASQATSFAEDLLEF
ncbi:hypothetical protein BESB_010030 [Besnoitia besnoiti]|uniref:Uncharacterized protein n=1 Tax=Besnoitia besnoiti TaxID=94643 RepID=A0A2A9MPM9_BESBE|nr:hypothetical protein BESB_010030 [Besnoitia besnoiti]PFH38661.1 hypothetical protein BESB_010030 [Besnoitia besnoiti]